MCKFARSGQKSEVFEENEKLKIFSAYAIVRNIPKAYHARDLREYFSEFVENEEFRCFHYRHRPEIQIHSDEAEPSTSKDTKRFCCVVSFSDVSQRAAFIAQYHKKFWTDKNGQEIPLKCFIFPLKPYETSSDAKGVPANLDFRSLIELRPPSIMPHGNVGTPTKYFLEQIRQCKLPPSILKNLGIKAKRRLNKYGAVHLNYSECQKSPRELAKMAGSFHRYVIPSASEPMNINESLLDPETCTPEELAASRREPDNDEGPDDDRDECEEWERHEALHDDVTEQERTKPKKYEEEQEVTWEKGGPGLVWHMDTSFWREIEEGTDSDWKWADDWDVDYSVYYDRKDGDLDAKQAVEMLEDQKLRSGEINQSVFDKKKERKRPFSRLQRVSSDLGFGAFEAHSKGIGSKIMKRCGWSPGTGLGPHGVGRQEAIGVEFEEADNVQIGSERKGLGYRGEKLQRANFGRRSTHTIATKYDTQSETDDGADTMDKVLRREEPTVMKYRSP
ncbi:unnamed protein product [Gongylonema pulchrum]|uniref:G-patch domain-containing protein n=1 Tax=Gongylonema pulchrum TaxID=637853 RepID=A0A183E907_9BILA|nr:unnamed protein product [Gongylonema pulchrum]